MEKPRGYIHIKKTKDFPEMGVLVVGRVSIPIYAITSVVVILSLALFIIGLVVLEVTGGQNLSVFLAGLVPIGLLILLSVIAGLIALAVNIKENIKKATRDERGLGQERVR